MITRHTANWSIPYYRKSRLYECNNVDNRGNKQGDKKILTRRFKKITSNFSKNSPNSLQDKKLQNLYNKAQFESPKHLHKTTFETLKYLQQSMFWTAYLGENVINLLKQKVAQNAITSLGYFQKIIMSLQKYLYAQQISRV
jgi:hypothetical protein